MTGTLLPI